MCTAITLRDVVREAQHRLLIGIVPLHGYFDADPLVLTQRMEDMRMQNILSSIDELDERPDPASKLEHLLLRYSLIDQLDADTIVEERQLAQAFGEDVIVKVNVAEYFHARHEMDFRSAALSGAGFLQRRDRFSVLEFHLIDLTVA